MSSSSRFGRAWRMPQPGKRAAIVVFALALVGAEAGCGDIDITVWARFGGDGAGEIMWHDTQTHRCTRLLGEPPPVDASCESTFQDADGLGSITFVATPTAESVLTGWSVPGCGTDLSCTLEWNVRPTAEMKVAATILLVPTGVEVTLSDDPPLEPGTTIQATANATPPPGGTFEDLEYTWASSDSTVASITGSGAQVTVTALAVGTTDITASARGVPSDPVTVTVTMGTPPLAYTRTEFVTVPYAFTLDFDTNGNLFVGNTGGDNPNTINALVRKVTPAGDITPFGDSVADPDVVLVDTAGRISTLGPNTVLTAGAYDAQYSDNHVTEIKSDGTVTDTLKTSPQPLLSNPSALAFLTNGDLLVGNYGNNTVSRMHRNAQGVLELTAFYDDSQAAPNALRSVAVVGDRVYVVTGSKRLTALKFDGTDVTVIEADVWPSFDTSDPYIVAAGAYGSWAGYLIAAGTDGHVWRIDTQTLARTPVLTFGTPVLGLGVSHVGVLYVMDGGGTIWKVTEKTEK